MSFDFSALLVLLTFVSGIIWAFDSWILQPVRERKVAAGERDPEKGQPLLAEYARSFFPVFLIVLILRSFLFEPFRIPSASMMPTLLIGDFILVNKYDYGIRLPVIHTKIIENGKPERGDIVVFRYPEDPSIPYIKRIIGVPGDHLAYRNKTVYINGVRMQQEGIGKFYGSGSGFVHNGLSRRKEILGEQAHDILVNPGSPSLEVEATVPPEHYFVLGDNRDNSRDSRYWGFVPDENLVGQAVMIWMNWDLKNGGISWKRIGTILQ
ncbi:MAG: signal peptidase I [Gammaproteobacteria bacterium]